MSESQKRRLGGTDLRVSVIGFGGIPIIDASKKLACEMITCAYELGINYFDTARAYGDSEEKFGEALKPMRDKVILATKTHQRRKNSVLLEPKQSPRGNQDWSTIAVSEMSIGPPMIRADTYIYM